MCKGKPPCPDCEIYYVVEDDWPVPEPIVRCNGAAYGTPLLDIKEECNDHEG